MRQQCNINAKTIVLQKLGPSTTFLINFTNVSFVFVSDLISDDVTFEGSPGEWKIKSTIILYKLYKFYLHKFACRL